MRTILPALGISLLFLGSAQTDDPKVLKKEIELLRGRWSLKGEVQFSLGFMKPSPLWPFGSAESFGAPGAGGSLGFADPTTGVGYAYVTSQMGTYLTGDPRDSALREALYSAIRTREV